MEIPVPIPQFPDYTITASGKIFHNGRPKLPMRKPGRSAKLRIIVNGKATELGLAKLLAQLFIPNPHNHQRIIFKDGNPHNCSLQNIQWVSHTEFAYRSLYPGKPIAHKKPAPPPKPPKQRTPKLPPPPPVIDPAAVPIPGWPGSASHPVAKSTTANPCS